MDIKEESLILHKNNHGKISITSKVPLKNEKDLSLAYTPGVGQPCLEIYKNEELVYEYTSKGNLVAVVTDGSAVLGLGNIGSAASMPVMEGKAILFKQFGGIDAFPICLNTQDVNEIVKTVVNISPTFGGINLEDISAPRCFEIEKKLKEVLDIPVFHDDQHGTAVVVLAGIINSLKMLNKELKDVVAVVNGAGAAGIAITKLLLSGGIKDIIVCDRTGIIYEGRPEMDFSKVEISKLSNKKRLKGNLSDAVKGTDIFIGVSAPDVLNEEMIKSMAEDPIIFALANPEPEIYPQRAKKAGAKIVGTGRSDFPNQINNVLAFPGIFRGALEVRAREINEEMKIAAAYAIAQIAFLDGLTFEYIIPKPFDKRVLKNVALEVAKAAMDTGVSKLKIKLDELEKRLII